MPYKVLDQSTRILTRSCHESVGLAGNRFEKGVRMSSDMRPESPRMPCRGSRIFKMLEMVPHDDPRSTNTNVNKNVEKAAEILS